MENRFLRCDRMAEHRAYGNNEVNSKGRLNLIATAVVVGAALTIVGAASSGFLFSATQPTVAKPMVVSRNPVQRLDAKALRAVQFPEAGVDEVFSTAVASRDRSGSIQQVGFFTCIGMAIGAVAAHMHQRSKQQQWSMAAMEAEDEDGLLPSIEEVVAFRDEYERLKKGKGEGAQLAAGEILRPVNFPGQEIPVDLVDMYSQFEEMLGDTVKNPSIGERILGTVYNLSDRGASVDFGGKSIGWCPVEELAMIKVRRPYDVLEVGDQREFDIIAPAKRRGNDMTLLSLKTIAEEVAWQRLQTLREMDATFQVVLTGKNRGGYMLEVKGLGVPGFLPKSQATSDLATAPEDAEPSTYMDMVVDVKVLDLDNERQRLVVSQRAANPRMATDTFKIGTVHEGIVQNVKPYGVFVDVNGMSGLLHISQISHNRIENVDNIFKAGDKIKCMVLSQDQVQGRLALSTKRLEPTHGDMLTNPQLVYEKAEEMAERFREDIAAAEKRMLEFEAKLAEQNSVAFS